MQRRLFLKSSSLALVGAGGIRTLKQKEDSDENQVRFTPSLNAYTFNKPLLEGSMSLDELFQFAKKTGFKAVDLTAYYIPGYPDVPEDQILYDIKKRAFRSGVALSGTGVRNDFSLSDKENLELQIDLVKQWIIAASKLGAPHLRVFDGRGSDITGSREQVKEQVIESFRECADFGSNYGVMVGFQNHNNFIKSTREIIEIIQAVNSEWFGLMLDIGSVIDPDPYQAIEQLIPYAVTWQIKDHVLSGDEKVPTDFKKLMSIVRGYQYQGYFPLEIISEGDPRQKLLKVYKAVT